MNSGLFQEQVHTAHEVELLEIKMVDVDPRLFQGDGNDALTGYLIDLFRESSVDLLQINAEAPQRLGPLYNVRVTMDFSGDFSELNDALFLLESQPEMIRVETVQISPADRGASKPMMQLSIRVMKEKQ